MSTADAVPREAAWLAAYDPSDGLPALTQADGGPWLVVQGYWPRTPQHMARGVYVLRHQLKQERFANVQKISRYMFRLICWWPLQVVTGSAETEQAAFDAAVDLVLQRITAIQLDKTHGGRFLSVAENPAAIEVVFHDPVQTLPTTNTLIAEISYSADDPVINE